MGIRRRVELVATTNADELSLRSLAEISAITADQDVRIIGGQMASLLLTAFPVSGIDLRRTRDADAAITTELAGSGVIHQRLLDNGYAATSGNSCTRPVPDPAVIGTPVPELAVDLLHSPTARVLRAGMSRTSNACWNSPTPTRLKRSAAGGSTRRRCGPRAAMPQCTCTRWPDAVGAS